MKPKPRPYLRSAKRISGEREKPKFKLVKVTEAGVRQCTVDLVSATALKSAITAFMCPSPGAPLKTEEYQIEML